MRPRRDAVLAASVTALALGPHAAGAQQPAPPAGASGALRGAVHGVVYDSLARAPLAGATVQVVPYVPDGDLLGGRSVAADSAGAFRIDALAPGRYLVGFDHPRLDLLRVALAPRLVELGPGGDAVRVDLGLPGLAPPPAAGCGWLAAPDDSSGLLAGRIRDAADGAPVAHATVVLTWAELSFGAGGVRTERRRVPIATGPTGTYVVCGVPAGVELAASAAAPGRASGEVALEVPPRGFVVRDLALGDTASVAAAVTAPADGAAPPASPRRRAGDATAVPAPSAPPARGTARLTGTVRDATGRPVPRARASVRGTDASATAGEDGAFALGALPAGTRTLEVRALGFAPGQVAVDLAPGRGSTVDVRLARVATLEQVTVLGTPSDRSLRLGEFLDRRRRCAGGRFLTAADFERWKPVEVTDALRGTGVLVVPRGRIGNAIRGPGTLENCAAFVYLDGLFLAPGESIDTQLTPGRVAGVEVYPDPAFAPPQYRRPVSKPCSVVLFWSRP
jgi:hypothetical protein